MVPITRLIADAISAAPKLSLRAASVRGSLTTCHRPDGPRLPARTNRPASGIRTMRQSQVSVTPSDSPKPGMTVGRRQPVRKAREVAMSVSRAVDLVEGAAVGEVGGLRLRPAAEAVVDRDQRQLREARQVGGVGVLGAERPVEVPGGERLALRRVEEAEIGLGRVAGALRVDVAVDEETGGSVRMLSDGWTISNLPLANSSR